MEFASLKMESASQQPLLARRAGNCLLLRPLPTSVHQMFYQGFCEAQGIASLSEEERIQAIEKLNGHEMYSRVPPSISSPPVLDQDFLHSSPTFSSAEQWSLNGDASIPGLKWCKELLVGDCQFDVRTYLSGQELMLF